MTEDLRNTILDDLLREYDRANNAYTFTIQEQSRRLDELALARKNLISYVNGLLRRRDQEEE